MSYYSIYDVDIDSMMCSTCNTEAFSWLAEIFHCPICGSNDYNSPQDMITEYAQSRLYSEGEIQTELAAQHQEEVQRHLAKAHDGETLRRGEISQIMRGRKRKRSLSDVGGRR
jgi:predicted RNA-binding Zn-ribbon protein involved in translation (DUF1610 family)